RDYDFWRRAQRHFRVTGFRDGNPTAITMVIARALDALKTSTDRGAHSGWPLIWPLYMRTVQLYLHDDLPALNTLLKREDLLSGPGTETEQILRSVVKTLPLHDVTIEQVRELYDLWGFERTAYVDEILATSTFDLDAVRQLIADSSSTLRREIAANTSETKVDLRRKLDEHSLQMKSVGAQLERMKTEFDEAVTQVRTTKAIASEARHQDVNAETSGRGRRQTAVVTVTSKSDSHTAAMLGAIQTRIEGLGRQLKDLRTRVDQLEIPGTSKARAEPPAAGPITARALVTKWSERFAEIGAGDMTIQGGWVLLEIVRRSRVMFTDTPALITTLFDGLPQAEVYHTAVSPLWLDEADWKESLSFIREDGPAPRLLVLSDFDVALQEAYLIPALINWTITLPPNCANRVLLVPSGSSAGLISPRVFELASVISHDSDSVRDLRRIGEGVVHLPPTLDTEQASASLVRYIHSRNMVSEDQLRQYAVNFGVELPARVLEQFVSLYDGLRASLRSRDASQIAQQTCLDSWVETARGETVARTLQEALRQILDRG
ncbi:MAG: hypothetical protein WCL08_09105, partial [Verrucomicrobiota bacterium]